MENIYSRIGDFFSKQAVDQATKENLRKVLSADQFAKQYPSVGRRFAGTLSGLFDKGKDFVGNIKFNPKLVKPVAQQTGKKVVKGLGKNIPYLGLGITGIEAIGNLNEGMNPVDAVARPLFQLGGGLLGAAGAGTLAAPTGPGALLAGIGGFTGGSYGAGELYDNLRSGDVDPGDPITGGFLGGPLPNVGESNVPSMEESLAKYGFNDNFELQPRDDGTFGVIRSDEGDYQDFLNRTRNSPAMQSGAFDPRELFETYKANQQFQADRKSGKLKKDRMAGERVRITMPMDLE